LRNCVRKGRNEATPDDEFKVFPALNPQVVYHLAPLVKEVPGSTHDPETFLASLYEGILQRREYVWVVTEGEMVRGYAIVFPPGPKCRAATIYHAYITAGCPMWVAPTMLAQITKWAIAAGAEGLLMTTTRDEVKAWQHLGFEKVADCYAIRFKGETTDE